MDNTPNVTIIDAVGNEVPGLINLPTCQRTKGVYEVVIPPMIGYKTPCMFTDKWTNLNYNGFPLPIQYNEFTLQPFKNSIQIGTVSVDPKIYGFDFYGIKQDEKILNSDIRKVGVVIKQAYTANKLLPAVDASYRVYVREGQTEVEVQGWTKINRTPNEYYFIFDTLLFLVFNTYKSHQFFPVNFLRRMYGDENDALRAAILIKPEKGIDIEEGVEFLKKFGVSVEQYQRS